jgi:microcystin-dependent protein
MAQPFLGQIDIFAFNFAPQGYASCNGQLLSIAQNTALFSILGTTYGGNGTSNFALPNLQASVPIHAGQGTGLSNYIVGQAGGAPTETLTAAQLPSHNHMAMCESAGGVASPSNANWGGGGRGKPAAYVTGAPNVNLSGSALSSAGGGEPHNNLSPYLGLMFCIALVGIFPTRN